MTRLASLSLADFRSYRTLDLRVGARIVAVVGPNGAGKTNLLEAVSLLAPGRGLRGAKLADLARRGADASGGFAIGADVATAGGGVRLGTSVEPAEPERRRFFRDGDPVSGAEAASLFACVWLTPQMDRLFTEGASARRRFLDRLALALDPAHGREVAAFEAASANRNRLIEAGGYDPLWCGVVEDSMARHAVALTATRVALIERLNALLDAGVARPFPASRLALDCPIAARLAEAPALAVEDWLRSVYAGGRSVAVAPISPQRADLLIEDAASLTPAALASTGQQRAMLVAIVLAHEALVSRLSGSPPVLLLDEPFVHLDPTRRGDLVATLRAGAMQVFCTATDAEACAGFGDRAAIWRVGPGEVDALD